MEGPKILLMQLKRYTKNKNIKDNTKIGALPKSVKPLKLKQHIKFHREMKIQRNNLQGRLSNTESYRLRGVVVHFGEATSAGHYMAYVESNDAWTEWNDNTGTPVLWNEVRTKEAYILLWERKDTNAVKEPMKETDIVTAEMVRARVGKEEEKEDEQNSLVNLAPTLDELNKAEKEMELDIMSTKRKREDAQQNKLMGTIEGH